MHFSGFLQSHMVFVTLLCSTSILCEGRVPLALADIWFLGAHNDPPHPGRCGSWMSCLQFRGFQSNQKIWHRHPNQLTHKNCWEVVVTVSPKVKTQRWSLGLITALVQKKEFVTHQLGKELMKEGMLYRCEEDKCRMTAFRVGGTKYNCEGWGFKTNGRNS